MDAQDPFKFSRCFFLRGMISTFLGFALFLQSCDTMKTTKEGKLLEIKKTNLMPSIAIPTIDESAVLKTETATFALG